MRIGGGLPRVTAMLTRVRPLVQRLPPPSAASESSPPMNELDVLPVSSTELELSKERTKRVKSIGSTVGCAALFAVIALASSPSSWPMAFGVAAVATMVTLVCYGLIKQQ